MGYSDRRAKVAAEIRAELARQGKSATQLATATGIGRDTMRRRLNGVYPFNSDELYSICHFLGISIVELTERTEAAA